MSLRSAGSGPCCAWLETHRPEARWPESMMPDDAIHAGFALVQVRCCGLRTTQKLTSKFTGIDDALRVHAGAFDRGIHASKPVRSRPARRAGPIAS